MTACQSLFAIVLLLCGTFPAAQATVVEGIQLRVGLWDANGRVANEIMEASSRAEGRGESFYYQPDRLYLLVAGSEPDTWAGRRFDLHLNSVGRAFTYTGPRELRFYSEAIANETTGDLPASVPELTYTMPEQANHLLLLFIPGGADGSTSYEVYTVDMSGERFPPGTLRVHNMSDQQLMITCGEERHTLESGGELLLHPDPSDSFQIRVEEWDPARDEWRVSFSRFQPSIANHRRLCLIANDPHNPNRIQPRFFRVE